MTFLAFLFLAVIKGFSSVTVKMSQKKYIGNINDSIFFAALTSFFQIAFIFLLPPYYTYHFKPETMIYPLVFSIFYILSFILTFISLKEGPTSLTVIVQNFNMFIPIIAGIFIWKETTSIFQIAGMLFFIFSLFVFNGGTYRTGNTDKKITLKWMAVTLASTFFSGCAITVSKQYALSGNSSLKEFLIVFNAVILIFCAIYFVVLRAAGIYKPVFHKGLVKYAIIVGLIADAINIIYFLYVAKFTSALFFPLMNTSSIIAVTIMSWLLLKEKISKRAYAGIAVCVIALLFLSVKI